VDSHGTYVVEFAGRTAAPVSAGRFAWPERAAHRAVLEEHAEFHQVEAPVIPELRHGLALVTLPHRHGADGFYGAVLERGTTGPR
jgi:hypothetical protein